MSSITALSYTLLTICNISMAWYAQKQNSATVKCLRLILRQSIQQRYITYREKRVMQLQNAMNKQGKKEREGERHPPADQEKRKKYQKERSEKRTRINIRKEWESNPTTNMEKARGRELKLENFHKDCNLDLVKKSVLVKLLTSKHKITGIITEREREKVGKRF